MRSAFSRRENCWKLKIGPFNVNLNSNVPSIHRHIEKLYQDYPIVLNDDPIDFYIAITRGGGFRYFYRPQVNFSFDGQKPFAPLPLTQAAGMFEWGLNWCVANTAHQFLIIHAAVVEKNGIVLIMPGTPGSGKSTLCASLVCQGWRLFSDEMALCSLEDGLIYPIPRPVSLKNKSIQIINEISHDIEFGQVISNTVKGDIAHMKAPKSAIVNQDLAAAPAFLIFPSYSPDSEARLDVIPKSRALMMLVENSFNFNTLGDFAFECAVNLIDNVECYSFEYPDLLASNKGISSLF